MLARLKTARKEYPGQFWLLFWGMLISTTGASMIWPFLMLYVSRKLSLPLVQVAGLSSLNAVMGLLFSFIAGPLADRLGRKGVMTISLAVNGLVYFFMSSATTLPAFAVLMALSGAFNPLYRVGADAMMADLIPPEKRPDAYSLMRLSNNVGVALGPAAGGFIAHASYTVAFYLAATGMITYSLLIFFLAHETLPQGVQGSGSIASAFTGYGRIIRDRRFISFTAAFTLTQMCSALVWMLLAVYTNQNYHLPENLFGFIPTTNALMVVFLQIFITQYTKKHPPLRMLALGSLLYALGVGSVSLGRGFWGFWISMVILTFGELILIPTSTTYAANLAPADMRGRYMSIYGLTWGIASGISPVMGGFLNDKIGPVYIWYGGLAVGLLAALAFSLLSGYHAPQPEAATSD